ncbi:hypothetical protein QTV44_002487 [Vibrio vulnificus]|nr:hypothetical protein [Vibrio vulnificus]
MMSFQFGVVRRAPCNVVGINEVFDWATIDGIIVGSPCDSPQQALEEAMHVLHRSKPYTLECWLADHIKCLKRVLSEPLERQDNIKLNEELSRYKMLHSKALSYRALCSALSST